MAEAAEQAQEEVEETSSEAEALADILAWSAECPEWQRDALRRLCTKNALEEADFKELTTLCKSAGEGAVPLAAAHIPDPQAASAAVTLRDVHDVENVNALKAGERFEEALKLYKLLGEYWNPTLQALKGLAHCALDQRKSERCRKLLALAQNIANRTRITDIPSRRASLSQLKEQLAAKCPVVESFKSDFAQLSPEEMMEELGF